MRESRGFYTVIEAADWLSAMWRLTETKKLYPTILSISLCLRWPSHCAQPISCLEDPIKTTTFILALYSSNDSWKVLDENVRIFNSLFQGYSN